MDETRDSNTDHRSNAQTAEFPCRTLASVWLYVISLALKKDIFQDIAQGQNANQTIIFVNDHKPMNSRLPDGIKDGVQTIID